MSMVFPHQRNLEVLFDVNSRPSKVDDLTFLGFKHETPL